MSFSLKVWLVVCSFIAVFIMFQSLDITIYKIFSYEQMVNNIFVFTPTCCVLCGSILLQVLKHIFGCILIPVYIAFVTYFLVLIVLLPYSIWACLLLGILAAPIGIIHYVLSVAFFGPIES